MNLPAPCSLRGSLGSPAGRAGGGAPALAEPSGLSEAGEGSGGAFSRLASLFFSLRGESPLLSHAFQSRLFPIPPQTRPAAEALGMEQAWSGVASVLPAPAWSVPCPLLGPGGIPTAGKGGGPASTRRPGQPGPLQRRQRWVVLLETKERVPTRSLSCPRPRECCGPATAAVPGLAARFPKVETTPQPGAARRGGEGWDGPGWAGAAPGAPHRAGRPLCRR